MGAQAPMIKNGRSKATYSLCYDGCSCHNDKAARRAGKRPAKRRDERSANREISEECS